MLSGVLSVFQTPYEADESIDWPTLEAELDWLLAQGADGVVMAMVSETLRLSTQERRELAEVVCRHVAGRAPVVISVGAESAYVAEHLAHHAEAVGATALMAIPPIATAAGAAELLFYYERLLSAVDLPLIVQDASSYVGGALPLDLYVRLIDTWGDRVYFKPEANPVGPRLSALRELSGGRARVFEGSGGIALVDNWRRGIVGTMPGAEIVWAIRALWDALAAGDEERAYALSLPISALVAMQSGLDGYLAVEKHLLVRQGVFHNALVRGPVGYRLDDETRAEVDRLFERLRAVAGRGS